MRWRFSALRKIRPPSRSSSCGLVSTGVRCATPRSRWAAASMSISSIRLTRHTLGKTRGCPRDIPDRQGAARARRLARCPPSRAGSSRTSASSSSSGSPRPSAGSLAAGPATAALTQELSVPDKEGSVTNVEIAKRYAGTGGEAVPLLPVVTLPAGKTVESPGVRADLAKVDATLEAGAARRAHRVLRLDRRPRLRLQGRPHRVRARLPDRRGRVGLRRQHRRGADGERGARRRDRRRRADPRDGLRRAGGRERRQRGPGRARRGDHRRARRARGAAVRLRLVPGGRPDR